MRTLTRLLFRSEDNNQKSKPKIKKKTLCKRFDVRKVKVAFLCEEDGRRNGRLVRKNHVAVITRGGDSSGEASLVRGGGSSSVQATSGRGVDSRKTKSGVQHLGRKNRPGFGAAFLVAFGILNVVLGILSLIWTPFELLMDIRLNMVPGLPPFDWWRLPPDEVFLRAYIYNITNEEAFMNGTDEKLNVQEVGPFVFLERLVHTNITFNDNGTMTYVAHRTAIFRPELTNVSLNATITTPNLAVLGMASKLYDGSFFTKLGYNMLLRRTKSPPLVTLSVYDYMWNWTDPLIDLGKKLFPFMVPAHNMGVLHNIYQDFSDEVTVHIGKEVSPNKFFTMTRYHGSDRFNYWPQEECDSLEGATEGVTYPQSISRNDTLAYFRKTICRTTPVEYAHDEERCGMNTYRFELPVDLFHRLPNPDDDCYKGNGPKPLPSGAVDVSPCYFDFPIAASMPHFLGAEERLLNGVVGPRPTRLEHQSYVIVEPITGVPLESRARSQSNLVVRPLRGFGDLSKFSDLIIPMFWLEYHQIGLPWYISYMMYFSVVVVPAAQTAVSVTMIALGTALLLVAITRTYIWLKQNRALLVYSSLDVIPSYTSSDC